MIEVDDIDAFGFEVAGKGKIDGDDKKFFRRERRDRSVGKSKSGKLGATTKLSRPFVAFDKFFDAMLNLFAKPRMRFAFHLVGMI